MKLLWASPTYGPIDPIAARHQRAAIMHSAKNGVEWIGDLSPDRFKFDAARNVVVNGAIDPKTEADAVFWVDSDVVLPTDGITRLAAEHKDFITGIYCQRYKPHYPLIANFDPTKETFSWFMGWPENAIAPIDGCGFGCVLTSVKMLRAMASPHFAFTKYSEDFDFCLKASAAGYQLFVHTGVLCGHLADPPTITAQTFFEQRDKSGIVLIDHPPHEARDSSAA
jgi:hypothetical protein